MSGDILLRQLEYLVALHREQHFGRAAAACHVSQPALSAAVRKLEQQLGVQIVRRGQRYGGLTEEGGQVLGWAHRILAERDALLLDLDRLQHGLTATVRVGAIPTAVPILPAITVALTDRHPRARMRIEVLSSAEIVRGLAEFELDAGLTYLPEEPDAHTRVLPLYRERYLLLTPDSGPLADREALIWADLAGVPMCALSTTMQNRRILDAALAEAGVRADVVVEADTVESLYAHLRARRWSSVVAHPWAQSYGVPDGLRLIPIRPTPHTPAVGLVTGHQRPSTLAAAALHDAVLAADLGARLDRAG
ncbi:LysR family transcriptional regulator [Sporichthya polymorpha]|uniref:LysR family transcriptional regulator n=1 Tax=Sporichthya polymorpha TaxID=35751 RepID=UPI00036327EF|nr:LysR family transcriptional regulator [Sporichthya polymorpha]